MDAYKKYRKFGILEWATLLIFPLSLIIISGIIGGFSTMLILLVTLFFIDLVEIKEFVKTDITYYLIFPYSKFIIFFKLLTEELFSIKILYVFAIAVYHQILHCNFNIKLILLFISYLDISVIYINFIIPYFL